MRERFGFTLVDATEEIHLQQAKVRQLNRERLIFRLSPPPML